MAQLIFLHNIKSKVNFTYDLPNVEGVCQIGDTLLFGGSAGLYKMTGTDDNGTDIDAYATTTYQDFGVRNLKSIDNIYLEMNGGPVYVTEPTEQVTNLPNAVTPTSVDQQNNRIKFGKGLKRSEWSFKFSNFSGSDFIINAVEFVIRILSRRLHE